VTLTDTVPADWPVLQTVQWLWHWHCISWPTGIADSAVDVTLTDTVSADRNW